uniref:RxLR effector candidate protein n=1 Tax=Hyaloperonospora arabidopsidis (strain Emoy2) TaxID=559515 RepID=M4BRL7_HYAAE
MRTAAVLGLALGVSSQSTAGRSTEAAACDARGTQPVHVVGVVGTFCVQRDVLGETELPTDSCCAVVDSDSGALGCVLVREGEEGDAVCLWSRVEEGARGSQRRRRRWSRMMREEAASDGFDSTLRFPADATRTDDVTVTRSEAFEATDAPPAVSLSVTTLPEAAEKRALEPEAGEQVTSAVGLTVAPVVTSTTSTVTTATAPVVTMTPPTVAVATYTPAGPNNGDVTVATVGTKSGTIIAATSDPVALAPVAAVAASAIPMLPIPAPSVATSTTPAINPDAVTTVPESNSFSGLSPVPVTSLPELSSMSDSIDEMVLPELSSMSGSADMMIQPELSSMSGSTDVVILPELSSMSGSTDADLVLTPTLSPSPATLPPFTAMLSSQSGPGLARAPTVISTANVTSMHPSTTPPAPTPVPGRNNTTPTPTPTLIVSGSSSGSDNSDDSGSFPEGSFANMPGPGSAIMSMEFSSSGSGDYPEIESTSAPAGTTGLVDGSRAAAISANVNDSSVSPPWLDNAGLKSGASSASIDVNDSWSPTSKSRGADSLDNEDSSVESLSGEVVRSGSSSPGSSSLSPLSTAPPLLFPSSGSLKIERLPPLPSESASPNGVLVLAPIMDHGGDSVNPLLSGGSQSPVNGEEIRGSGESSAADTQTVLFIIIGCIVAAALVSGAVWLRPKRANSVDISNLREPPEPMDTSYPYVESEPAGPYDASRTPRVINGYDRMDMRGSNEYFSA